MKKVLLIILAIYLSTANAIWAENEATYDPKTGKVVIPNIIIKGSPDGARYKAMMQQNGVTKEFTLAEVDQKSSESVLVDSDVEKYVTIPSGLYGQVLSDESGKVFYKKGSEVLIFSAESTDKFNYKHIATTLTDQNGFYQLALIAGDYEVCFDGIQKCSSVTFGDAFPLQRCDLSNNSDANCRNVQPETNIINQ